MIDTFPVFSSKAGPVEKKIQFQLFAYWHDKGWKGFVGATVKIWDLAHNLSSLGQKVVMFLPAYPFPPPAPSLRLVGIPLLDVPLLRALSFNFALMISLVRQRRRTKPDVVYIRRGISLLPAVYARLTRSVLVYEVNDDPFRDTKGPPLGLLARLEKRMALKTDETILSWCDAAFVITAEVRDRLRRYLPDMQPEKIHLLPSGTNTELYHPLDKGDSRSSLRLAPARKYVGFMGTLLEHQGVEVLIDAAPVVLQTIPDVLFIIIGEGPCKEPWRRKVAKMGLGDHFMFAGQIDYERTPLWINAMDVCAAPFLRKAGLSSPVKIFDYLACGRPVVASRLPGTTDPFASSGAVRLVEPENSRVLADALIDILQDDESAERMGRLGRKLVESRFSRLQLAREVLETAQRLCERRRAAAP